MESSSAEKQFMTRLNEIIDANLHDEKFGVSELASELGMNRATLHRKVKAVVNQSVSSFIREARLKRAHQLLQQKTGTVSEIAYQVGFGSVPYFTRSFHKYYGYTPGDVLKGDHFIEETEKREDKIPAFKELFQKKTVTIILTVFILMIFAIAYIFVGKQSKPIPNTIAVLPFVSDSLQNSNRTGADGISREIIYKLNEANIPAIPYPIIHNYKSDGKNHEQIAKELNVGYILYSKIFQNEDVIKISFDLISGSSGNSVWTDNPKENLDFNTIGEDFRLQDKIAFFVAGTIKGILIPEDTVRIREKLMENSQAYDNYKRADMLLNRPDLNLDFILRAKSLLERSIQLDPGFSEAYASLGQIYAGNLWFTSDLEKSASYLDSAKIFYEKALVSDSTNKKAIEGLWNYYRLKGMDVKAKELESGLPQIIENYLYYINKFAKGSISHPAEKLEAFYKYLELKPDDHLTPWWMYHHVYYIYMRMGFPVLAKKYCNEEHLTRWSNPLPKYSFDNSFIEECNGNYDSALVFLQKSDMNSAGNIAGYLMLAARNEMRERDFEQACIYLDSMEIINPEWLNMLSNGYSKLIYPFGYSYLKTGRTEKGNFHLNGLIAKYEKEIEQNWVFVQDQFTRLEIALAWSALGNAEKALDYLEQIVHLGGCQLWFILEMKNNPMFDTIRQNAKYAEILKKLEANYNREHERIKKLLISKGIEPA